MKASFACVLHIYYNILLYFLPQIAADRPADVVEGQYLLKSYHGTYLRVRNDASNDGTEVELSGNRDECARWNIQKYRRIYAVIIPYCSRGKFLYATGGGNLTLNRTHEMWLPGKASEMISHFNVSVSKKMEEFDNSWAFLGFSYGFLTADWNGSVYASVQRPGTSALFELEPWTDGDDLPLPPLVSRLSAEAAGKHCVRTGHGTYLRAWKGLNDEDVGWQIGVSHECNECEQWMIEDHEGTVALREYCTNQYLHEDRRGLRKVDLAESSGGEGGSWIPHKNRDGSWSFESDDGQRWLAVHESGNVIISQDQYSKNSPNIALFHLEDWPELTTVSKIRRTMFYYFESICIVVLLMGIMECCLISCVRNALRAKRLRRLFDTPLPPIPGRESKRMLADDLNGINNHIYEDEEQMKSSNS